MQGVCPYGFEKDMSERVYLKVIFLSFISLYTNWGIGAIKGGIRG